VSGPRPPKNHPSCADRARYVRSTARPIEITVAAADPILLAVARASSRWRHECHERISTVMVDSGWTAGAGFDLGTA
jgi:hypothetical protein